MLLEIKFKKASQILFKKNINTPQNLGLASGHNCPGMRIEHELPDDQRRDDEIAVCFDSESLIEDLEVLGAPKLEIEFSVDKPDAYLITRICEVSPEGVSERVSFRPFNLSHHISHEFPEKLVPGKFYKVAFDLNHDARGPNRLHKDGYPAGHFKCMIYIKPLNESHGKLQIEGEIFESEEPGFSLIFHWFSLLPSKENQWKINKNPGFSSDTV